MIDDLLKHSTNTEDKWVKNSLNHVIVLAGDPSLQQKRLVDQTENESKII